MAQLDGFYSMTANDLGQISWGPNLEEGCKGLAVRYRAVLPTTYRHVANVYRALVVGKVCGKRGEGLRRRTRGGGSGWCFSWRVSVAM